jgi:hypothetical protein
LASTINKAVEKTGRALGFKDFFSSAYKFVGFSVLAALPYIITNLDEVGARLQYHSFLGFLWSLVKGVFLSFLQGIVIAGSTLWYGIMHATDLVSQVKIGTILYVLFFGAVLVFTIYQPVKIIGKSIESSFNPFLAFGIALLLTIGLSGIAHYATDGRTISNGITSTTTSDEEALNETLPANDAPSYAPSAALDLNEAGA